ncbi:hypothetical protein CDD80_2048 [Ophiocordyceps camponoti-rufipedis]|uniref:Velvet domain-containing protein n=1 Tax=Ophiocordyceps camponoti-rufipedis TaxID=2004952 RepID=A0A2C5XKY3_9HYPO|nr:hypothetical protein CDD80_2048 [Ophiocordyceps camponoti-rufipedis]
MATPASIPTNCSRDSVQRIQRITRENRSLWYQLTVLQQPERARACGSGMKANSDRRPVDPPPVVELRIIEGASVDEGKDITFDYNANFFLYASLEPARVMATARATTPTAANPPILTGVPASGMAYLDRPAEAGYFIFPDLSVRHEGYFRLSFSLFETTKEERDFDLHPSDGDLPPGVDWRMEIKTQPFSVFSAKKFPGLMESTQLSKTVADQGCRVRIRRDVRMRKRDGKSSGYDRREEGYDRRRNVTPAREGIRPRSLSSSSDHRAPYAAAGPIPAAAVPDAGPRRPSAVDAYAPPPPPPPPPPPVYDSVPGRGHLSFGDAPRHYPAAAHHQPPPASPGGPYPSTTQSPYGYHHGRPLVSSACPSPALSAKQEPYDRASAGYATPSPSEGHSRRDSHASLSATPLLAAPPQRAGKSRPSLASLKIASLVSPLPPLEAQTEPLPALSVVSTGGKRKHEIVFQQSAQPLHNGRRQQDPHYGDRPGAMHDPGQGMYLRADGKQGVVTFSQWQ